MITNSEQPWKITLICCGRDDGVVFCSTWAEAEAFRESYTSGEGVNVNGYNFPERPGHQRAAIISRATEALPIETPDQGEKE